MPKIQFTDFTQTHTTTLIQQLTCSIHTHTLRLCLQNCCIILQPVNTHIHLSVTPSSLPMPRYDPLVQHLDELKDKRRLVLQTLDSCVTEEKKVSKSGAETDGGRLTWLTCRSASTQYDVTCMAKERHRYCSCWLLRYCVVCLDTL